MVCSLTVIVFLLTNLVSKAQQTMDTGDEFVPMFRPINGPVNMAEQPKPLQPQPLSPILPPPEIPSIPPAPRKIPVPVNVPVQEKKAAPRPRSAYSAPSYVPTIVPAQDEEPVPEGKLLDDTKQYQILLDSPSLEAIFSHLDSEKMFEERMNQQSKQSTSPSVVRFPNRPVLSKVAFVKHPLPQQYMVAEPNYVVHQRLYFEEKNSERYGWDLGYMQPVISLLNFYKDVVFLPHNFMSYPSRRFETSAGQCLPGDPVPYIFYPPELTLTGAIAEGALAVGLVAILP